MQAEHARLRDHLPKKSDAFPAFLSAKFLMHYKVTQVQSHKHKRCQRPLNSHFLKNDPLHFLQMRSMEFLPKYNLGEEAIQGSVRGDENYFQRMQFPSQTPLRTVDP